MRPVIFKADEEMIKSGSMLLPLGADFIYIEGLAQVHGINGDYVFNAEKNRVYFSATAVKLLAPGMLIKIFLDQ